MGDSLVSKKKGFTLVELLVAIACGTIILTTVITSLYFISRMGNKLTSNSSNLYKISIVRDYIVKNDIKDGVVVIDGDVIINEKTIVYDSLIKEININNDICTIIYDDGKLSSYSFIIR